MSYLNEQLGEGEHILFRTHHHGFILVAHVLIELILFVLLGAAAGLALRAWPEQGPYIALAAAGLGLLVLLSAMGDYLRWRTNQFVVTDRRVLQLKGVINKRVLDSSLEKINDVQMQQSLFGRMFDYGTIEILTASEEAINRMDNIANPIEFKRAMQDARARYDGYLTHPQGSAAYRPRRDDVQGILEQLAALHDSGILTDAEFEAKKREVLSRV